MLSGQDGAFTPGALIKTMLVVLVNDFIKLLVITSAVTKGGRLKEFQLCSMTFLTKGVIISKNRLSTDFISGANWDESNALPSIDMAFQSGQILLETRSVYSFPVIECMKPGTCFLSNGNNSFWKAYMIPKPHLVGPMIARGLLFW